LKPHVRAAAKEVADTFGITDIGGYSYRDIAGTNTLSDHAKGLAIDVMTTVKGQQVANWATQNAGRLSITYVIWNRQYYDTRDGKGWVAYKGVSPHTDHVHISFYPTAQSGGGPAVPPGTEGLGIGPLDLSNAPGCLGVILKAFGFAK
jgi:hypothetical protein